MTKTTRRRAAGVAVVVAVLEWTSGAAATESGARSIMAESLGTDGRPTAVVRVDNEAAVSAGELESAEGRAEDVFRRIGIRVTWVDKETAIREDIRAPYTVVVMVAGRWHDHGGQQRLVDDALGLASPVAHRAYVYYDRVMAMQVESRRSIGSTLGDVIAHELGHLLLPPPSHSSTGIMRTNISFEPLIETFNGVQARQVRSRLRQAP
jgi:hypothetical protein